MAIGVIAGVFARLVSIISSAGVLVEWYRIRKHSENAKTDAIGLHNYRLLVVMHSDSLRKMAFYGKLFCMRMVI